MEEEFEAAYKQAFEELKRALEASYPTMLERERILNLTSPPPSTNDNNELIPSWEQLPEIPYVFRDPQADGYYNGRPPKGGARSRVLVSKEVLIKALHQRIDRLGVNVKDAEDTISNSTDSYFLYTVLSYLDGVLKEQGLNRRHLIKIWEKPVEPKATEDMCCTGVDMMWTPLPFQKLRPLNYGVLYDRLVEKGFLEDTGKQDFVYYFTGKGETIPKRRLIWKTDSILLSVLMQKLITNQMPWKRMSEVFECINTDSMKTSLANAEKREEKEGSEALSRHRKTIDSLLS